MCVGLTKLVHVALKWEKLLGKGKDNLKSKENRKNQRKEKKKSIVHHPPQ